MDVLLGLLASLFSRLDLVAAIEIIIVALLIYGLQSLLQETRALVLMRGAIILIVSLLIIVNIWPFQVLRFLVINSLPAILVAIPVVFAPEIRHALEQIGHTSDWFNRPITQRTENAIRIMISEVVKTCYTLSSQQWGGLFVIERGTGLQDVITKSRGILVEGRVSEQLLVNIFVPNTPLHDGAVIIRGDQIIAAAAILPLTDNTNIQQHYGTRHRAALGISENSDAVAIVISEETGSVSVAVSGKLYSNLKREDLTDMLIALLVANRGQSSKRRIRRVSTSMLASLTHFFPKELTGKNKPEAAPNTPNGSQSKVASKTTEKSG
jgi:diadenylate cyclase